MVPTVLSVIGLSAILSMDTQTVGPFVVEISAFNKIGVLAAIASGPVMPWSAFDLVCAAPLADFHRAIFSRTEWSFEMPISAFGQRVFHFVKSIHLL